MKILIIAQYFPPDMGGGATRAYNVAKGLELNGCEVTVIAAFPHYPSGNVSERYRWKPFVLEDVEGFRIVRTFVPPLASQGLAKRLVLFLSFVVSALFAAPFVGKVDVVWAANPNVLSVFPVLFYGFVKRKPVALNVDDLWPEDLHNFGLVNENSFVFKMMCFLAKLAYMSARLITPISPGYVRVLCGKYGVSREKVWVVRAGVDLDTFGVVGNQPNRVGKDFRVLYSGAFSVAYDFDQVLLAAKRLENVDGVEFVLQGGGELAGYVKSRVKEFRLSNVIVIDRIVSRAEVAKLLSEADALILPLRDFGKPYLGISSKLYEYQAAGKPIICCAEGQPAEYVKETGSRIVVKPGDYEALAKAVLYLKENRDVAEKLGASGRQYVENNLSIEKIGSKMMTIFKKILANSSQIDEV
jgi:glycosyltransferase involved in cell wall biosynthesis